MLLGFDAYARWLPVVIITRKRKFVGGKYKTGSASFYGVQLSRNLKYIINQKKTLETERKGNFIALQQGKIEENMIDFSFFFCVQIEPYDRAGFKKCLIKTEVLVERVN